MPQAALVGLLSVTAKVVAAKTLAIGFAVAFKAFAIGAATSFISTKLFSKKPSKQNLGTASAGVAGSTRGLTGAVIPKRWIVGRARVSGALVWFDEPDDRTLNSVLVLSAGSIDGIERLWAHGDEVEMVRDGNVLTPAADSKYWGLREESYTETYEERVPISSGGEGGGGFTPSGPGRAGACGGCRSSAACNGRGADSTAPGTASGYGAHDGSWTGGVASYERGGIVDMSPWAIARYNEAVSGTAATAGAFAGDGVSGQQGENDEEAREQAARQRSSSYTTVTRTRTRTREVRVPLIKITEFFAADGRPASTISNIASSGDGKLVWDAASMGHDVSYVLVELFQPDYGTELDNRFWPGIPQMEFLVRGLKIQYPVKDATAPNGRRLTAPAWTRNAAAIRYWHLTERRNIDPLLIDIDYFESAFRLCNEELRLTEQSGYHADYPEVVSRYTIDGSVNSGDSATSLDAQFDFAWNGFVVEHSGRLLFRPGADLTPRWTITEDDIIGDPTIMPFGARSDLANEFSVQIEQSSGSDYREEEFTVTDTTAISEDGERLPQELARLSFVVEPVQVVNLLTQRLRQQRGLVSVSVHVKSPPDWRYLTLVAGDKIELEIPEYGIGVSGAALRQFRVTAVQIQDDYSVQLNLLEWPVNLYNDTFDFPPRIEKFGYEPRIITAPVGRGSIDWNVNQGGDVVWTATLIWDASVNETIIDVRSDTGASIDSKRTRENMVKFELNQAGRYTFNLRHVSNSGIQSAQSQVVIDATYTDIPLPRPVVIDAVQNANLVIIRIENVPNRDIAGVDVRYNSRGLDDSIASIPPITEVTWETSPTMNVSAAVPVAGSDDPIYAYAAIPVSGTYKVYVRLRNRVGNLSPISGVVDARFEIAASTTGSQAAQPSWPGTFNNALLWTHDGESRVYTDPSTANAIPYSAWEGGSDFPFGEHSASTSYTTIAKNFQTDNEPVVDREVYVAIETGTPAGKAASNPSGFQITLDVTAETDSRTVVNDGQIYRHNKVSALQAAIDFNTQRNHALTAVTIGWRDIDE